MILLKHIYPDYYEKFRCIASRCHHNCCIGWEIDIDEDTACLYKGICGDFGKRLRENISEDTEPHFILKESERCPFLSENNLCDIITTLGEESLCHICKEHPRFHTELPDRIESGLGLCCEEAARLILTKESKTALLGDARTDDEIILMRDKIIETFQDRDLYIEQRIEKTLELIDINEKPALNSEWTEFLLCLERLSEEWTGALLLLSNPPIESEREIFKILAKEKETIFEQFIVYLLYRHVASAPTLFDAKVRIVFVIYGYRLFYALSERIFALRGNISDDNFIELGRLFSSEIEYSDENLYEIFDKIENEYLEELL